MCWCCLLYTSCVGGPLTFENMFIARNRIRLLAQMLPKTRPEQKIADAELDDLRDAIYFEEPLKPFETTRLDEDFKVAMDKMARIRQLLSLIHIFSPRPADCWRF